MPEDCRVIQVTNVSSSATKDQMKTLFGFIGKIDDMVLYPTVETANCSRVCYVKFDDPEDVGVAMHLSNTVFIDRALIVVPVPDGKIPDEQTALGAQTGGGLYAGLVNYPALPETTEPTKVDEIRRTVYVGNVDPSITPEILLQLFGTQAGEVKYIRMAGEEGFSVHAAFIEFTEQVSVMRALALTGHMIGGRPLRVSPANTAIAKQQQQASVPSAAGHLTAASSKEIEEAMRKVNEAQPLIAAVLDPDVKRHSSRSRSRSRRSRSRHSRSKRRSRSRSRSRRSRSRKRSRTRSPPRRRSRSRSPRRRSRSPRRRRSRSPVRRHRSRSRSRDRRRHRSKSRSPRPSRSRRSRSPRDKARKSRSQSREGSPSNNGKGDEKKKSSRDIEKVKKESSVSSRHRSRSPARSAKKRSRSRSKSAPRSSKKDERRHRSDRDRSKDRGTKDSGRDRNSKRGRDDNGVERDCSNDKSSKRSKSKRPRDEEETEPNSEEDDNVDAKASRRRGGEQSSVVESDGNQSD